MTSSQQLFNSSDEEDDKVGLLANGGAEGWEISVDEMTSGPDKWFAQIEGPFVYLYFEIASPSTIEKLLRFLQASDVPATSGGEYIELGMFNKISVKILRDDEYQDRYFLCVGDKGRETMRISLMRNDIKALSVATRQIYDELKSEEH